MDEKPTEGAEPHPAEAGTDEESNARGMAVSELTAKAVGKPELADHDPAGPAPDEGPNARTAD